MSKHKIETDGDNLTISAAEVEAWKKEKEEILAKIQAYHKELRTIENRLRAVAVLTGTDDSSYENRSPADAVIGVLQKSPHFLKAGEIRKALAEGHSSLEGSWGRYGLYFYAVLKRLADQRKITKLGNTYGVLPRPKGDHP